MCFPFDNSEYIYKIYNSYFKWSFSQIHNILSFMGVFQLIDIPSDYEFYLLIIHMPGNFWFNSGSWLYNIFEC